MHLNLVILIFEQTLGQGSKQKKLLSLYETPETVAIGATVEKSRGAKDYGTRAEKRLKRN